MARKVEKIGNGSALINGAITNLKQFKNITESKFGLHELEDGTKYGIAFTPMTPSQQNIQDGVDGTYHITYKEDEKEDYEADFKALKESM